MPSSGQYAARMKERWSDGCATCENKGFVRDGAGTASFCPLCLGWSRPDIADLEPGSRIVQSGGRDDHPAGTFHGWLPDGYASITYERGSGMHRVRGHWITPYDLFWSTFGTTADVPAAGAS